MNVKDAVATRFQQICRERKLTLNELAYLSGVTPSTLYSMMDERRRDISIRTIKKFCDGLDMPLAEFFNDTVFDDLEQEIQ
ncbi:MAG: helix-turn-helix transcriptional regulator [Lachnospiraceae bacterium]|nr:helix-turn-helix transcriptional regulator [Lachnospiraceae bacterium]